MSGSIPLYTALMKAGAPEEDARLAAESVVSTARVATQADIARVDRQIATKADMAEVRRKITVICWMTAGAIALLIAISARLLILP